MALSCECYSSWSYLCTAPCFPIPRLSFFKANANKISGPCPLSHWFKIYCRFWHEQPHLLSSHWAVFCFASCHILSLKHWQIYILKNLSAALYSLPLHRFFKIPKLFFLFSCHKGYAISIRLAKSECFESFKYLFRNTVNSKFLFRIVNYATHIWEPETVDNKSNSRVARTSWRKPSTCNCFKISIYKCC